MGIPESTLESLAIFYQNKTIYEKHVRLWATRFSKVLADFKLHLWSIGCRKIWYLPVRAM
jgi:hypothetical protein